MCIYIYRERCIPVCMYTGHCRSIYIYIYLYICLFVYLFIYLSMYLSIYLYLYLNLDLYLYYIYIFIHSYIYIHIPIRNFSQEIPWPTPMVGIPSCSVGINWIQRIVAPCQQVSAPNAGKSNVAIEICPFWMMLWLYLDLYMGVS